VAVNKLKCRWAYVPPIIRLKLLRLLTYGNLYSPELCRGPDRRFLLGFRNLSEETSQIRMQYAPGAFARKAMLRK
jgi:hypothetical protein